MVRKILSCYARGAGDAWEGICLDLDIAVQGDSLGDVREKLSEAIKSYFEYVVTLPEEEQKRLLSRRVPWHVRSKYVIGAVITMLFRRSDGGE